MRVDQLVGLPYRLGADPERHGATDCLGLCRAVLATYGIESPAPTREWYRRLRQGDHSIFPEQLRLWGEEIAEPKMEGTVALCQAGKGYGLSAFWCDGWLIYKDERVHWCPTAALPVVAFYYRQKPRYVMRLD